MYTISERPETSLGAEARNAIAGEATCPVEFLVLDDNRIDLERVKRLIRKLGFPVGVTTARTLQDFAREMDRRAFDLIILDFNLQDCTGLDAMSLIRAHHTNREAAILMLSDETDSEIIVAAIRSGCSNFLPKERLALPRLREVVLAALHETFDDRDAELDRKLTEATRLILGGVAGACLDEFRPVLSRMFRQIKILRTVHATDMDATRAALKTLDDGCLRLWRFVSELETYADSWHSRAH